MKPLKDTFKLMAGASMVVATLGLPAHAANAQAAATACQSGMQGCVLPVGADPVVAPIVGEEAGFSWLLPALLGVAAIVGGILIFADDDDDEDEEPISP